MTLKKYNLIKYPNDYYTKQDMYKTIFVTKGNFYETHCNPCKYPNEDVLVKIFKILHGESTQCWGTSYSLRRYEEVIFKTNSEKEYNEYVKDFITTQEWFRELAK